MAPKRERPQNLAGLSLRLTGLAVVNAGLMWLIVNLFSDGAYPLAIALGIVSVFITAVFSFRRFYALRWLSVGLAMMIIFVLYPIFYTFYLSTTNTGLGHILTKQVAIERIERERYVPEGGQRYNWTAFQAPDGEIVLWLQSESNPGNLARPGEMTTEPQVGEAGIIAFDEAGIPTEIEGYRRLERRDIVLMLDQLSGIEFGEEPDIIRITSVNAAANTRQRYIYQPDDDAILDLETGTTFTPRNGTFVSEEGQQLRPGFFVHVGTRNFNRFFSSAALRGPVTQIVIWNFAYAGLSVLFSFALGLFIAILFDQLPGKNIIRTLLIVPYPIPALVSILIWRNLLNPDFGALVKLTEAWFGSSPAWLTDPNATRAAIILVNMWLSYPYFYIVSSGALQALPTEIMDAASVDGASPWQRFSRITLPLLLRIVSPLLVASFAFNFNNFNLIYIFNEGNPPIAGSPIPAGHTDILISFVYKLAFSSAQADYGLAATISIVLFALVALITWLQFRYTRVLEDAN